MPERQRPPAVIANSIRQKREVDPERTFLLVEGDDDRLLFGRHLKSCSIIPAWGRPHALAVIAELERTGYTGALAIVDADFTVLEGEVPPSLNVLLTDHHDVECMMLDSPALAHVLRELGDEESIGRFEQERGVTVQQYLLSIGIGVGYLRWASARNGWKLKFEELDFARFIRERDFHHDPSALIIAVRGHQGGRTTPLPSEQDMRAAVDSLVSVSHDQWHVCRGHDLVEILSIGLRKVLGKNNDSDVRGERLEQQLRLAYEERYFQATRLYAAIIAWQQRNPPFKVL